MTYIKYGFLAAVLLIVTIVVVSTPAKESIQEWRQAVAPEKIVANEDFSASPTSGTAPLTVNVSFPPEWRSFVDSVCSNNTANYTGRSFSIDWGDGTFPHQNGRNAPCRTHTYTVPGTYTLTGKIDDFSDVNGTRDVWTGTATITVH